MSVPKRAFLDGQYGQIHYRQSGLRSAKTHPLVCLHMFPQSGRNFERLLSVTPSDRLVIAPDFPGYGESSPPPHPISAQDYASAIWQAIDMLDLLDTHGSVDLFGIHAGAKLAVEVAYQRPNDVRKIVLSSAAVLHPEELDQLRSVFSPIPLDDQGTRLQHLWNLLIKNRGPSMSYEMMAVSFAEMLRGGEGYEWGHHAVFEYNAIFPDVIASLQHSIKLLNPNDDLYEMTPRTQRYLQNGDMVDRPDWGQGFLESNAEDVWQVIQSFLDAEAVDSIEVDYAAAK
ncbi:MAG: alpha/beta hydrolase [Pseudomonadota bacterium]